MNSSGVIGFILLSLINISWSVQIPDDIEILDGYRFDSQNILNPESAFFGSSGPRLYKAIRDKRSAAKYEVLESPGLKSHFHLDSHMQDKTKQDAAIFGKRSKRETEGDEKEREEMEKSKTEVLPTPEKFVSEPANYFRDSHKTMEQWSKTPYTNEFSKVQKEEDDSQYLPQADASTINEGIKARAPRVNFITQQNKPEARDRQGLVGGSDLRDLYKIPNSDRWTPEPPPPPLMSTRSYDEYPSMYNRNMMMTPPPPLRYPYPEYYDERKNYNPYYEPPYVPRGLLPRNPMMRDPLRDLPSRDLPPRDYQRYDYADARGDGYYRDYRPLYNNDINDRMPMNGNRNRRIIYYANLPEIVRTPPNVDLNYNNYEPYYPYRDYYPNSEAYRSRRERDFVPSQRPLTRMPPSPEMRDLQVQKDMNKYSSAPLKISSSLRVDNQRPDRRMFTEVNDSREGRPSFQDGMEDRKRSYLSRHN